MGRVNKTDRTRKALLEVYRKTGRIDTAAAAVGTDRSSHYRWLKDYPEYREAFEACADEVAGLIEDNLHKRAFEGVEEPVFHGGKRAMDFARDEQGNLIRKPCATCEGKGKSSSGETCGICKGTGRGADYVAVPASIRRLSDACALAIAAARVPGYSQRGKASIPVETDRDVSITVEYTDKTIPE